MHMGKYPAVEILVVNLGIGRVRKEHWQGKEYLVAPLTLIVPGVLNGSKGPLYYPSDEIEKGYTSWNGIPIVVNHPTINGIPVSARDPYVLARYEIGRVYRSAIRNGALTAEGWFDPIQILRVDNRINEWLMTQKPFELSTGLNTDNEPAPDGSQFNGKPYTHTARNYRPDHVAVLPDQIGACSIRDGCGVLINQLVTNAHSDSGEKGPTMNKEQMIAWLTTNCDCWKGQGDREILNAMSEEKLRTLQQGAQVAVQHAQVANAVKQGFDHNGTKIVYNMQTSRWDVTAPVVVPVPNPAQVTPPVPVPAPVINTVPVAPVARVLTDAEWMVSAPPGIKAGMAAAMSIVQEHSAQLVNRLVANIADPNQRTATFNALMQKPVEELKMLVSLIPQTAPQQMDTLGLPTYLLQSGMPSVANQRPAGDEDDILPPTPSFDYREHASKAFATSR